MSASAYTPEWITAPAFGDPADAFILDQSW